MIIYDYIVLLEADLPAKEVLLKYINPDEMKKWQPELKAIETTEGTLFQQGSEGFLVYQNGADEMKMKIHVDQVTDIMFDATYEVPGVFNRTTEYFLERQGKLLWKSVVEFRFDAESVAPKGVYEVATKKGMQQFIDYLKKQG